MPRSTLYLFGGMAVAFISGLLIGLSLGDTTASSRESGRTGDVSISTATAETEGQSRLEANTLLSGRIRELNEELTRQKTATPAQIMADRLAFFQSFQKAIRLHAFEDDLKVTPEMTAILGLTPEQVKAIENHLASVKKEMDALQEADTSLIKQTSDSVTYEIAPDAKGQEIKADLANTLAGEIGEAQAKLFMAYDPDAESSDGPMSGYAAEKRDIDIKWADEKGKRTYTVKNSFFNSQGNNGWSSMESSTLPAQYSKYVQTDEAP